MPASYIAGLILFGALRVLADYVEDANYVSDITGETLQLVTAALFSVFSLATAFKLVRDRTIRIGFVFVTALVLLRHVMEIVDEFEYEWIVANETTIAFIEHAFSVLAFLAFVGLVFFALSRLSQAVNDKEETEKELETLAHATASTLGENTFRVIARAISETLGTRGAMITELVDERLEVLAFWDGREFIENFGSYPSTGSPCGEIIEQGCLFLPEDATSQFPGIRELIQSFDVTACCGVSLHGSSGIVGTLVLLHDGDCNRDLTQHPALRIVAAKAATEIEQRRAVQEKADFEQQFQETQRLESLGILAGGVAHDFNNLLAVILGNADLARHAPTGEVSQHIEAIVGTAEKASSLTGVMLDYVGGVPREHQSLDLARLTTDSLTILRSAGPKKATISVDVPRAAPVRGDPGQLGQVIINLVTNAQEALANDLGDIRVSIVREVLDKPEADPAFKLQAPAGPVWVLTVSDTGVGMDPGAVRRIFDPFYTTKATGRGLGLSAVLGIVRSHGGTLRIQSEPGSGTSVSVVLPQADLATDAEPQSLEASETKGFNVLVIEDEPGVRDITARILNMHGFHAVLADSGSAGLNTFSERPDDFDVVVLDIVLPDVDGYDVRKELIAIDPEVRILMMSGYTERSLESEGARRTDGFLHKPFRAESLINAINRLLDPEEEAASLTD